MNSVLPWDLPFEEAMAFFRSKGIVMTREGWRQLWQSANARSFTVARVTQMDVLQDIKAAMQRAIDEGTTLAEFKREVRPMLEARGWFAPVGEAAKTIGSEGEEIKRLSGWRLDTIFNANVQTAYSVGRYQQQLEVAAARPYLQYHAILDAVTRPDHAAQDGKVYAQDHPYWDAWYPPNGFNCRCYVTTLSAEDVRERGLEVQTAGVREQPDEGWRYNVGAAGLDAYRPDLTKYPAELREQYERDVAASQRS